MKPILVSTVWRGGIQWHTYLRHTPRQASPTGLALLFTAAPPAMVGSFLWPIDIDTIEAVLRAPAEGARARLEGELARALRSHGLAKPGAQRDAMADQGNG